MQFRLRLYILLICLTFISGGVHSQTGLAVPGMTSYDQVIPALMKRWSLPGASVAVMKDGKLVFARGYGVANSATGQLVQPQTLFRIASVSKPLTSALVMKLIEQGKLTLDTAAFPMLNLGKPVDMRIDRITIRNLLEHSGGWDRSVSGDPMVDAIHIARVSGVASPPDTATIIRYMLSQRLDFEPGARYAYSNFGYCVLGRVIEKITGQPYEDYAKSMLREIGVSRMRLGHSLPGERGVDESNYYDAAGASLATSVFDRATGAVHWPDGGFALESMDAHGGWLASAVDLVMFASAIEGKDERTSVLTAASKADMLKRPVFASPTDTIWYGKGWQVNKYGNYWHTGSLPGTTSILVATSGGVQWSFLTNMRSDTNNDALIGDIDKSLWEAYLGVTGFPGVGAVATTMDFVADWNLVGNGTETPLAVTTLFSNTTQVHSVWRWLPQSKTWAMYEPGVAKGGSTANGYATLTQIEAGEGFWVRAKVPFSIFIPAGYGVQPSSFKPVSTTPAMAGGNHALGSGWRMVATAEYPTPTQFAAAIATAKDTLPSGAKAYTSLKSWWAWDAGKQSWYFWSPSLANDGTQASYLNSVGYSDTTSLPGGAPGPTSGFWVNLP